MGRLSILQKFSFTDTERKRILGYTKGERESYFKFEVVLSGNSPGTKKVWRRGGREE